MNRMRRFFRYFGCLLNVGFWPIVAIIAWANEREVGAAWPAVLPWWMVVLLLFFGLFPIYGGVIGLFAALRRMRGGAVCAAAERYANLAEAALFAATIVFWVINAAGSMGSAWSLFVSYGAVCGALLVSAVSTVAFRRRLSEDSPLRRPLFYILLSALLLLVLLSAIWFTGAGSPNQPDPLAPVAQFGLFDVI